MLLRYPVLSETFISDEIEALTKAGHAVMTVSLEGGGAADIDLAARRARSAWTACRVISLALRGPIRTARALAVQGLSVGLRLKALAAAEEARRHGVDTVHAHFAYRNADAAQIIGAALGTGHSVTTHAHDIFVENRHLARRLRAARKVVTVCRYNADHLTAKYPYVTEKLNVIPCSTRVDPDGPADDTGAVSANSNVSTVPTVLSVGRLVEKKGFDDLIVAAARMSTGCRIVIIGDGPLRESLNALIQSEGVSDRVVMIGALNHRETLAWFRRADVFCLACKVARDADRDSMPVVVKEAMAAALPVVATDEVGIPEMLLDGETGILVPPSHPSALAAALDELVGDPVRRTAMGLAGRKIVEDRFDLRVQAEMVAHVIGSGGA